MEHELMPNDDLLRLLALKRHERPPPGYFDDFAQKIIAQIEAGEAAREMSWWQRVLAQFDARPILACAYGVAIGAALVIGVSFASVFEESQATALGANNALLVAYPAPVGAEPGPRLLRDPARTEV